MWLVYRQNMAGCSSQSLFFFSAQFSILSQGTTFNFLAIGGLLLVVAELGFMGEMEPRLVSELQLLWKICFFILFPWQETINGTLQYVSNSTLKPVEVRIGVNIEKQKLTIRFSPLRASSRLSTLLLSLPFSLRWVSHDHSYQYAPIYGLRSGWIRISTTWCLGSPSSMTEWPW